MEAWDLVGTLIVILGAFLIVGGIGLSITLMVEGRWWKGLVDGMMAMPLPEFGLGAMIPMMQQVIRGLMDRVFLYVRLGALLGGLGLVVIGAILIVFGAYIIYA